MTNMTYCRFQNTLTDLADCYMHWDEECSEEEAEARERMLELCKRIVEEFGGE